VLFFIAKIHFLKPLKIPESLVLQGFLRL